MPPAYPPEVRVAALAARRNGVKPMEIARALNISPSVLTNWTKEAGIPLTTTRCGVCNHPNRDLIDAALIAGSVQAARDQYGDGLKFTMLDRHRRLHLAMPLGKGYAAHPDCVVCDHPDRDQINQALRQGRSPTRLAEQLSLTIHRVRHHQRFHLYNPARDAALARAAELRLQATRKLEERAGPPEGWYFCPECDSPKVHATGSGHWKDDPGPIYWHVTKCLDCGWPHS